MKDGHHRRRWRPSKRLMALLRPFMRFSFSHDGYVLRFFGGRHGPVLLDPDDRSRPPWQVSPTEVDPSIPQGFSHPDHERGDPRR